MLQTLKKGIKKIVFSVIKPPVQYVYNSYGQAGEDAILKFLFEDKKIVKPSYLELGVYIPDKCNNTYLFYLNGSRGVCVEADASLIPDIKRVRSNDKVLNIGVGINGASEADFYIFDIPGLNTFDKEEAEYRQQQGLHKIVSVKKVELRDINSIIADNFYHYPHLLSIDIEGLDLEVLKTLDFDKYPIPVICAETCTYSENHVRPKDTRIAEFMQSKGYFIYGDTYINTIFVNTQWFHAPLTADEGPQIKY